MGHYETRHYIAGAEVAQTQVWVDKDEPYDNGSIRKEGDNGTLYDEALVPAALAIAHRNGRSGFDGTDLAKAADRKLKEDHPEYY